MDSVLPIGSDFDQRRRRLELAHLPVSEHLHVAERDVCKARRGGLGGGGGGLIV